MSDPDLRALLRESYDELKRARARLAALEAERHEPVAVVAMACRLPGGVRAPEDLWGLLREGRSAIRAGRDAGTPGPPGGYLDDVDRFDAAFFEMTPQEARVADPQQRLLLECAWEALERAGLARGAVRGARVGVFVGASASDYAARVARAAALDTHAVLGAVPSALCGRVSYFLGTTGPSVTLDAGCASSLVAVHFAAQALRRRECDAALAGGVNVILQDHGAGRVGVLSPRGRCRPFDAAADGFVRGEGCGLLLLKRWSDARRDGDPVLAVLRGSATNHVGASNGMSAPNAPAQEAVIRDALRDAGLAPAAVSYVEAHGTGTPTGDAIEAQALGAVYGRARGAGAPLLIGSAKAALGHGESAAGVASLIKAVACLQARALPASPVEAPSRAIPWDELNVALVTAHRAWEAPDAPRRAGVHGYSMTGANAHLVLEEAPAPAAPPPDAPAPPLPFVLSGHTEGALVAQAERLLGWLDARPDVAARDLAWSLARARTHLDHRLAVPAGDLGALAAALRAFVAARGARLAAGAARGAVALLPEVAFACAGGAVRWEAARDLAAAHPRFRELFDGVAGAFPAPRAAALRAWIAGEDAAPAGARAGLAEAVGFAAQVALARLLQRWGVAPDVVVGEGRGVVAAACVAGALDLQEGARLSEALSADDAHLRRVVGALAPRAPATPLRDGATGDALAASDLASADYWSDLRHAGAVLPQPRGLPGTVTAVVTLGPDRAAPTGAGAPRVVAALREDRAGWSALLEAVAALHVHGVDVDWAAFFAPFGGRRVLLPTYAWQRQRHWIDDASPGDTADAPRDPWLYRPRPTERARLRLFCFHYAGGSAQVFREWPAGLGPDVDVCAVQLPGRGARFAEAPFRRMGPLLDALEAALGPALDEPCAFFGHSMGALVAFELARRLRGSGRPLPRHLFASGRRAPQLADQGRGLHALPDADFLAVLRRYGGVPEAVLREPEVLARLLPVVRADFEVLETWAHVPEAPLPVPLTALGGDADPDVDAGALDAWRAQTSAAFARRTLPGGHLFLHGAQRELLAALAAALG